MEWREFLKLRAFPAFSITGSPTFNASGGTVNFDYSTATQIIQPGQATFYNVTFAAVNNDQLSIGTLNVAGNLTLSGATSPATNIYGGTIAVAGNVSVTSGGASTTTAFTFTGGAAQTYTRTAGTFTTGPIVVNKTTASTLTLDSDLSAPGGFTVTSGIVSLNGYTLSVGGDLTITDTVTAGSGSISAAGSFTNNGTFTAGTGTVTFTGANGEGPYTIGGSAGTTFNNLTINASGYTGEQTAAMTVNGNLAVTAGTLNSNAKNLTLGGNFTKSGTYTSGNNTVTLTPGASHTFTGNSISFYNLTMNDSSATSSDTVTFVAGKTYTVTNVLTLEGSASANLKLRSATGGTQWKLTPSAPTSAVTDCLDVEDSDNTSTTSLKAGGGSGTCYTNSADDTHWSFP